MHPGSLLADLALVLLAAGLVTALFQRLRLPLVLGYLLAGLALSSHVSWTPVLVDEDSVRALGDLGVVFLLFSVGLEFSLKRLKAIGLQSLLAAAFELAVMLLLGFELGRLLGFGLLPSLFLAGMIAVSSTTIIVKSLRDLGLDLEPQSRFLFGLVIAEDLLAIALIAVLSSFAATRVFEPQLVLWTLGGLGLFLVTSVVAGLLLVPRLLRAVAALANPETLVITVVALVLGYCWLAASLGYSVALGAFLIGAIMAESEVLPQIQLRTEPIRDLFTAVFFVATGMLLDPHALFEHAGAIALLSLAVVVGKFAACSVGAFLAGQDLRSVLRTGASMTQIGEFSFILAAQGLALGVTGPEFTPIVVGVCALTALFTPALMRRSDGFAAELQRRLPAAVLGYFELYSRWVGDLRVRQLRERAPGLLRKWVWQMLWLLLILIGLYTAAAVAARRGVPAFLPLPGPDGGQLAWGALLWVTASLCALPLLVAAVRKLGALGELVAGFSVRHAAVGSRAEAMRRVVRHALTLAGTALLGVLLLALSSAILPPGQLLLALALVTLVAGIRLRASLARLYQNASEELDRKL